VGARHSDKEYKDAVLATLEEWGWSAADAQKTIFINSREIPNDNGVSVPGTQGLVIFYENVAFIAFRGSEKKLNDWLANVNTRKVKSPYVPGNVHSGFLKAFEAIVPDKSEEADIEQKPASLFEEVIDQLRTMEAIWLTGHSLGGAIASIGASYLHHRGFPESRIYVYTFGAPRVGDAEYRSNINKMFTYRYWRFLHNHDIVPDVPFPGVSPFLSRFLLIGFSREGCMLRLKRDRDTDG
jgi:predicted lipase